MHGKVDNYPNLTGKYEVKKLLINQQVLHQDTCADSLLTVVYFDIKNGCVFQFNTPAKRWNGSFTKTSNHINIKWYAPSGKPVFNGTLSTLNNSGNMTLTGMLGKDSMDVILQKVIN
ncbi:MAG: hypothetical protein JWR61_4496 [Ferruginibacter sp.]|nr:hypothetical protein [Ferruginibacter sp.]